MPYEPILKLFLIASFLVPLIFTPSYSLTESVDLFGQINSADLVLNDIWMEPENPKEGEPIAIHGSIYNAGVISTNEISNVVTVGYMVNGELVEIDILENVLPGVENGTVISSGPIFDAISGNYIVTVIVNYHDNLSHLRDNPENNIVQKMFQIGTEAPSLINANIYQHYDTKTKKQNVAIEGELTNIIDQGLKHEKIIIDMEGFSPVEVITNSNGGFSFETDMPFKNEPIQITAYSEEESFIPSFSKMIFPIKLDKDQSSLALEILPYSPTNNFKKSPLTIVIFQDSYDNLFKKISTADHNNQSLMMDDFFLTVLPADHEYIIEVYIEGRLLDAFQKYFPSNEIIKKEISISESSQVRFLIINENGDPQSDVIVDNWIYSTSSDEDGFTEWIEMLPTFTANEPYVAKATFPNEKVVWSEPFLIEDEDRKVIHIIQKGDQK